MREVEAKLGPIDRLYNCAGIMPFGKLVEQDNAVIHRLMAINYGGLVNITQAVLPGMLQRGRGDFVSFASMAGIIPMLLTGAYTATKFAVVAFTETLYHEHRTFRRALCLRLSARPSLHHCCNRAGPRPGRKCWRARVSRLRPRSLSMRSRTALPGASSLSTPRVMPKLARSCAAFSPD